MLAATSVHFHVNVVDDVEEVLDDRHLLVPGSSTVRLDHGARARLLVLRRPTQVLYGNMPLYSHLYSPLMVA